MKLASSNAASTSSSKPRDSSAINWSQRLRRRKFQVRVWALKRMTNRIAAIILAAGGSRRLGTPKQLLCIDGESLVRRAARVALASRCRAVFVVLGAHAAAVGAELDGLPLGRVTNRAWREGMGSSIRAGIASVARDRSFDAALLLLADQPGVTAALIDRLANELDAGDADLVACTYAGTVGAPALFARRYFPALQALRGDRGAKSVLLAHADAVVQVPFPAAALDVDTHADSRRLTRRRPPASARA
jgi:molybdenum cofactor cytidylyltransferase